MTIPQNEIKSFQNQIFTWYKKNKRDLPWRSPTLKLRKDGTRDPYAILVSEVMSQQTQLARVVPKFVQWMEELPMVESLASAKQSVVLRLWSGLGYNRRALFLQKAAQSIGRDYKGMWPRDEKELEKLPGIGKYTAAAIACFAFNKQIPVIDTNIRKVVLTQFGKYILPQEGNRLEVSASDLYQQKISDKEIEKIALQLLPQGRAYEWNQALMDYSAMMLKQAKIPIPKQSTFLGSRRSYRGKILKLLLQHEKLTQNQLFTLAQDSHSKDEAWFAGILADLLKEGLIRKQGKWYVL